MSEQQASEALRGARQAMVDLGRSMVVTMREALAPLVAALPLAAAAVLGAAPPPPRPRRPRRDTRGKCKRAGP